MNFLNNFNISFSISPYLLVLGIILIILFSIYVYRITLPAIGTFYKILLITLRTIELSLILLLLFEPNISYKTKENIEPTNLVLIDNSKSISQFASTNEISTVKNIAKEISDNVKGKNVFFEFGKEIKKINSSQIDSIKFVEQSTNLSSPISLAKNTNNLSSIILFSDGIITEGENPISQIQNLGVPVYAIGVGDITNNYDVEISKIKSNEFIYVGATTKIEVTIKHNGLTNKKASLQLIENNKIIEQKPIVLSPSGTNRITFDYSNKQSGEHKLIAVVKFDKTEKNKNNNTKSKIINVVDTKKKIFIISGSPNSDLSAITSSLKSNKDFNVETVVQFGTNKFYKNKSSLTNLKKSDILFLINFPSSETSVKMINEVLEIITSTNKPIFYCLSSNIDYTKLKYFKNILPFKITNNKNTYEQSQVIVSNSSNNLLGNNSNIKNEWTKLPPINIANSKIVPNVSTDILLNANNNKSSLIFTNSITGKKSVVINVLNFWRWKLKAPIKEYKLFDNFLFNSVKWLSLNNDDDRFNITLTKKNFNLGETIVFTASVYDETLEPINNASIQLEIEDGNSKIVSTFNSIGNGFYESSVNLGKPGLYNFIGKLLNTDKSKKNIKGKFNIEPIEIELTESKMNKELLVSMANVSKGKFFSVNNSIELISILNENYEKNIKIKFNDNELILSSLGAILFTIIFLFGLEWLIRKILKML